MICAHASYHRKRTTCIHCYWNRIRERMIFMQDTWSFTILGEDKRLFYTAEALRSLGHSVECTAEHLAECDILLLPVPVSRDGVTVNTADIRLDTLSSTVRRDCRVFCGMPRPEVSDLFFKRGIRLYDYAAREEFAVRNAVPTAEGAAEILLRTLPVTLRGARIFITGYGRCARACARLFTAMGARVTVAARRCSALAMANADGYNSVYLRELPRCIGEADAVVNTVPAPVLGETVLSAMRRSCPIVEIASAPYGVDTALAAEYGITVLPAPSLPGKVAPKTAGIIIADTVLNILREGSE